MASSLLCGALAAFLAGPASPAPGLGASPKPVGYRADACRYLQGKGTRTLTCEGHVKIWRDDLSLACDRLVATFSDSGALATARCLGSVQIIAAGTSARAQEARYDGQKNQVELSGRPSATQRGNILKGQQIRVDVGSGDIFIEGAVEGVLSPQALPASTPAGAGP
jgi:lipopolysaccharide transport protein LptA